MIPSPLTCDWLTLFQNWTDMPGLHRFNPLFIIICDEQLFSTEFHDRVESSSIKSRQPWFMSVSPQYIRYLKWGMGFRQRQLYQPTRACRAFGRDRSDKVNDYVKPSELFQTNPREWTIFPFFHSSGDDVKFNRGASISRPPEVKWINFHGIWPTREKKTFNRVATSRENWETQKLARNLEESGKRKCQRKLTKILRKFC